MSSDVLVRAKNVYKKRLRVRVTLLMSLVLSVFPNLVFATLQSSQIAILANENSHESGSVAKHYAKKRGIPGSHIIELDTSSKETISRQDYEESILEPVRKALETRKLSSKVRVLVTTFGIPLRVQAQRPSSQEKSWGQDAKNWRKSSAEFLEELKDILTSLASPAGSSPKPADSEERSWDLRTSESLIQEVNQVMHDAYQGIEELSNDAERSTKSRLLEKTIKQTYGLSGQLQILQRAAENMATAGNIPLSNVQAKLRSAEQILALFASLSIQQK